MTHHVNAQEFLTTAVVFNTQDNVIAGTITADANTLKDYNPANHEFYCPDCLSHDHAMRVVRRPEDLTGTKITPPRFVHYRYEDATHICDHPVRYNRLDELAARYNAETIGPHAYIFDLDLRYEQDQDQRVIDRASRMAKLTLALLYDPVLRGKQKIRFPNGDIRSFEEGLYRSSPDEKIRLFEDVYEAAKEKRGLSAAQIFRPIANRRLWKAYEAENCIPGIAGREVDYSGLKMQPSTILWCDTKEIYWQISKMCADQKGRTAAAPIMVVGDAQFSFEKADERARRIKEGEKLPHALHSVFKIKNVFQVEPWAGVRTFEDASVQHAQVQSAAKETVLKRQKEFIL